MIYTISALAVIGLCIYVFFAFGLPKIVSCYASRKFKADVSIGRIDLFRRELVKIRFVKGRKLNMYIQNIKFITNFFSSSWASLITVKISGLEAKVSRTPSEGQSLDESKFVEKIVQNLAFIKFLVTFRFESVYIYIEGERFVTMNVQKAEVYPESTRSGLLNIIAEVENADIQGPDMSFGSVQDTKMIGVFNLGSSVEINQKLELEHVEFSAANVRSNVPLGMVKAKLQSYSQSNSQKSSSGGTFTLPNINLNIDEVDLSASFEKLSWASNLTHVKFNHHRSDKKFELNSDEIYISDDKGSVFIQQAKISRKFGNLLATWNHISVQASVESLDCLYELKHKLLEHHPGSWTKKLPLIEDTTLAIEIDSGTVDYTEFNIAFHVQQISSKVGLMEQSQAGNNFFLDNFHIDFDKERHESAVTVSNVGMALCEESLNIIVIWSGSLMSKMDSNPKTNRTSDKPHIRWSMRTQSVQIDYCLTNNLSCQLWMESSKSKGQGSVKGIGFRGLSLAIKEPSMKEEINVIQVQDMYLSQDSSKRESFLKFPNKIMINWSTLAHRVLFDITSLFRQLWLNSMLRLIHKSRKSSKGLMTTSIVLQKGILIRAKLQNHVFDFKVNNFDMRKVGEEWKLLIPEFVVDVVNECTGLFKLESLLVQKSMTNPLNDKYRMEIDGLVDKENITIGKKKKSQN